MTDDLQMKGRTKARARALTGLGKRTLAMACLAVGLVVAVLALGGSSAAAGHGSHCPVTDLGTLNATEYNDLVATGSWSAEDCDSRFRVGSDAHTYRFEVVEGDRVRIDLVSTYGDSYLYLLAEDGSRLADNDDGGANLNARIERDLAPGIYLVEATTVGGRARGPADFTLQVSRVTGCDPVHLGSLEAGRDLTASGTWTLNTCGSRFVVTHPAYAYSFHLPQDGRVLIDLTSTNGDPVLSLISLSEGLIDANDDGGERYNSRIERFLPAGTYLIEATTYRVRDRQPISADFDVVIHLVDETEKQRAFQIKVEAIHTPDQVIAGEPFPIHYRLGNLGHGNLADAGGRVIVYTVAPRVFRQLDPIAASDELWQASVSYHAGDQAASETSRAIDEVTAFEITLTRPGPSWVFVAALVLDESGREIGFHGLWHNLTVLSSFAFDPVTVQVDGVDYAVSTETNADGIVTTSVRSVTDPNAEVDAPERAKAIYTAGVLTRVLDGIFDRPAIATMPTSAPPSTSPVNLASPSSSNLLKAFGNQYVSAITMSGLAESLTKREAINPLAVEDLMLNTAETASARYVLLADSWRSLQGRIDDGETLSFVEAFAVQSQLAYAERIISPAVTAAEILRAAQLADLGWEDPEIEAMIADFEQEASCRNAYTYLQRALEAADISNVDRLLELEAELRAILPVHGLATDSALCAAVAADDVNSRFLRTLSIGDSEELRELIAPEPELAPEPTTTPHRLRIIARLGEDGTIEHGVELSSGEQILPSARHLPTDAPVGEWRITGDVEVDGSPIGKIRLRILPDGRMELGFLAVDGETIRPDIRYLPASIPTGVWLRSGEFEVSPIAVLE